jgi:hypothetical protein
MGAAKAPPRVLFFLQRNPVGALVPDTRRVRGMEEVQLRPGASAPYAVDPPIKLCLSITRAIDSVDQFKFTGLPCLVEPRLQRTI